nr:tetratricopeptide repeat protein [Clostridium saccharoperbutylacetonicum]
MKKCSFLRYLFDAYFEDYNEIKNIQDYISVQLREYVNSLADKVDKNNNSNCDNKQKYLKNIYDQINYISTLTYEGSNVSAKIVLLKEEFFSKYIRFYIKLKDPINFEEYRKVRKLLETSDKTTYLIGDNERIYGLGSFKNISEFETENIDVFVIDFIGRFEYKISTLTRNISTVKEDTNKNTELKSYKLKECNLVNVRYGKPNLKEHIYSEGDLVGAIKSIFKNDLKDNSDEKIELLKNIINYAKDQKHGTTVVITTPEKAKKEVVNLEKQSMRIEEKKLENNEYLSNIINRITNIDGALYIDINGTCHSIGVILDGEADSMHGDSSRGARFNSAIKYSLKKDLIDKCIIVVISEDGMVNIIHNGEDYKEEKTLNLNKLFNESKRLLDNNEYTKLLEKSNEIINTDINNAKAYFVKGLTLRKSGQNEEAIECYNKAIELKPDYAEVYNNKGNILQDLGQNEEAIECYDKAIELNPDYVKAYNNKGSALQNLGQNEEAIECYDKAKELSPDYVNAYYNKGTALMNLGQDEEAIGCYDKAIELSPDYVNAYNNKGTALKNLGQNEEAIECYDKAIELSPDYVNAYNNKGNVLQNLGQNEEAIECYDKAIELNPDYAKAYYNKGNALKILGKNEKANICFEKYEELKKQQND